MGLSGAKPSQLAGLTLLVGVIAQGFASRNSVAAEPFQGALAQLCIRVDPGATVSLDDLLLALRARVPQAVVVRSCQTTSQPPGADRWELHIQSLRLGEITWTLSGTSGPQPVRRTLKVENKSPEELVQLISLTVMEAVRPAVPVQTPRPEEGNKPTPEPTLKPIPLKGGKKPEEAFPVRDAYSKALPEPLAAGVGDRVERETLPPLAPPATEAARPDPAPIGNKIREGETPPAIAFFLPGFPFPALAPGEPKLRWLIGAFGGPFAGIDVARWAGYGEASAGVRFSRWHLGLFVGANNLNATQPKTTDPQSTLPGGSLGGWELYTGLEVGTLWGRWSLGARILQRISFAQLSSSGASSSQTDWSPGLGIRGEGWFWKSSRWTIGMAVQANLWLQPGKFTAGRELAFLQPYLDVSVGPAVQWQWR